MFFKKPKVGLALGSGGSRGIAHIGVIKCLLDHQIPIDYLAGTSAGALIGGIYSRWQDTGRMEKLVSSLDYRQYLSLLLDPVASVTGLIKGDRISRFLEDQLGKVRIEDLKTPFAAVATDCLSGQPVILDHGGLVPAIRASTAIPVFFSAVKHDGHLLMDGGSSIPVPVSVVKDMGADITIGVNVYTNLFPIRSPNPAKTIHVLLYQLSQANLKTADIQIEPLLPMDSNSLDFVATNKFVDIGYQATLPFIPQIRKLLRSHLFPFF
jgi:NTE family protein